MAETKRTRKRTVTSRKRTTSTKPKAPAAPPRDTSPVGRHHEAATAAVKAARNVETAAENLRTASLEANKRVAEAVGRFNELSGTPSKNGVGTSVRRYLATKLGSLTGAKADQSVANLAETLETALAVDPADEVVLRKRNP